MPRLAHRRAAALGSNVMRVDRLLSNLGICSRRQVKVWRYKLLAHANAACQAFLDKNRFTYRDKRIRGLSELVSPHESLINNEKIAFPDLCVSRRVAALLSLPDCILLSTNLWIMCALFRAKLQTTKSSTIYFLCVVTPGRSADSVSGNVRKTYSYSLCCRPSRQVRIGARNHEPRWHVPL